MFLWFVTLCSLVYGYYRFSKMLVIAYKSMQFPNAEDNSTHFYCHGISYVWTFHWIWRLFYCCNKHNTKLSFIIFLTCSVVIATVKEWEENLQWEIYAYEVTNCNRALHEWIENYLGVTSVLLLTFIRCAPHLMYGPAVAYCSSIPLNC